MQLARKSKTKNITIIILAIILFCVSGFFVYTYFFAQHEDNFSESVEVKNKEQTSETDQVTNDLVDMTDNSYIEDKTPVQYEGQTDNSSTHGDFNNEQFRIPEGEL